MDDVSTVLDDKGREALDRLITWAESLVPENKTRDQLIANARGAFKPKLTHGRHCSCSACAAEDWTRPELACCGMHGPTCPAVYAPLNEYGIPETLPHEISEDE